MSKIKSTLSKSLPAIIVSVITTTAIIYAAWQEPTQTPPYGNVPAPINVGTEEQSFLGTKTLNVKNGNILNGGVLSINGGLGVSGVFEAGYLTSTSAPTLNVRGSNVGIGTTTTSYKLTVSGSAAGFGTNFLVTDSNTTATVLDIGNTSAGGNKWRLQSVGSGVTDRVGNFEIWKADSHIHGLIIKPNGNVGMGTLNPLNRLDVGGGVAIGAYAGNNTSSFNGLIVSGSVGIGTATPSTKLEIAGQIKITGGNPDIGKVLTSDATGLASWQRIISGPQFFTSPGNFHTFLPAGTYYITAIGGGGGSGGAQAGSGTKDGGGGGGGAYVFAKCIFTNSSNELSIIVGKGGDYGTWGTAGLNGGTSRVLMNGNTIVSAEGGKGGKCSANNTCNQDGSGGSLVSANKPCSIVASAPGGNGGPNADIAGSGGGGAGNGGLGGKSPISGHDGSNGGTVNNSLADRYSIKGGDGGYGQCNRCNLSSSTECSNLKIRSNEQPQGFPGKSPGGGAGSSCNGAPGSNGGDGVVIIYPEL
jgi:hypothetical protein